jgi:hypothetical protein
LPDILKWMKQTFAVRCNRLLGRTGHLWGDRFGSVILEGVPPVGEMPVGEPSAEEGEPSEGEGGRPRYREPLRISGFSPIYPQLPAPLPP